MSTGKWIPLKIKLKIMCDLKSGGNAVVIAACYDVSVDVVNKIKQRKTNLCKKYETKKGRTKNTSKSST